MSVLTFVYVIIYAYILLHNNNKKGKFLSLLTMTAVSELMFLEGAFLKIGDTSINFKMVSMFALFIYTLYFSIADKLKVNAKLFIIVIAIIIYGIIVTLYYNLYPPELIPGNEARNFDDPTKLNIIHVMKLIMFSYCLMIAKTIILKDDCLLIINRLVKYGKWLVYYVTFEFIANNFFKASVFIDYIQRVGWARQAEWGIGRMRGDLYELRGLSAEPSHLCIALFSYCTILMIYYFYCGNLKNEKGYNYLLGGIYSSILMLLSTGSSAYIYCVSLICMFLILKYLNLNNTKGIAKFSIGLMIVFCSGATVIDYMIDSDTWLGSRLTNLSKTIEILNSGILYPDLSQVSDSSLPRFLTIYYSLIDFSNYPFTGIGLATSMAHDSTVTLLLDFGIVGSLLFFILLFYRIGKKEYKIGFVLTYLLLGGLLCGSRHMGFEIIDLIIVESTALINGKGNYKYE